MIVALFAIVGLAFGSFLTVVVHRTPLKESVVRGRSRCPGCGTTIAARDNVPVVSYLLLRGRCRHCGTRISPEYPLTELGTAVLFAAAALLVDDLFLAAVTALFLGVLLAVTATDLRHRIIPNAVVYPSLIGFAAVLLVGWLAGAPVDPLRALLGFLAFGGGLLALALIRPGGMGMGDVKLAALIGLVLGAQALRLVAVAAGLAILAGGVGGVAALAAGRSRKSALPFGPFLALGGMAAALWGAAVADWYAGLLGA